MTARATTPGPPASSGRKRGLLITCGIALMAGVVATAAFVVAENIGEDEPAPPLGAVAGEAQELPERPGPETADPNDPAYDAALSTPRVDSKYPDVGNAGVDALHYYLDLDWDPDERVLTGVAEIAFRVAEGGENFMLDLDEHLEVASVVLDGTEVDFDHSGKDLVVEAEVNTDDRHLLVVEYAGTPEPYDAPTTRSDFDGVGLTTTDEGHVWTMQEPYGAFTWYPVNDQPADKAFYDFTISAPAPLVGVANGQLVERVDADGDTITQWHLDSAASSYLTTIAIAEYEMTEDTSSSGVPLTYWTSPDQPGHLQAMRFTKQAVDFLEEYLGPFPFTSLGSVVVDSESAMETQQMITYGNTPYTLSPDVVVHEVAHQWYGDIVSPSDWRDVWMNEGMAMYLQGVFEAEATGRSIDEVMDNWATYEVGFREQSGPPGDYDPAQFGTSNIYYGPALMWHELRKMVGDDMFWSMVRAWPAEQQMTNPTREEYLTWVEEFTGEELTDFFTAWLMGAETPPRS